MRDDLFIANNNAHADKHAGTNILMNRPTLSVCISTHDEYENAWNTINALLLYHGDVVDEIVVCDNSPNGSEHAKLLEGHCAGLSKVKYDRIIGPPSACKYKDRAVRLATSEFCIVCDTHVLFYADTIRRLMGHFTFYRDTNDLITGPVFKAHDHIMATNQMLYANEPYKVPKDATVRHGVVMRGGTYGVWVTDPRGLDPDGEPFEIMQNGTGAMAFRRAAWPGVLPSFNGHGGTETWIMESFRRNGGRVLCAPWFRWVHQWGRPGMATRTREAIKAALATMPSTPTRKLIETLANDIGKSRYDMLGWKQKVHNTLTAAVDLGRTDLYDAAMEEFTRGGPNGRGVCPKSAKEVAAKIPRVGLYDELLKEWQSHGGNPSGAICRRLFNQLETLCRRMPKSRVLEFGSGLSTLLFQRLKMNATSIEDSRMWFERLRPLVPDVRLVHSPLEHTASGQWYDWRPDANEAYDVILIDGPIGEGASSPGRLAAKHFIADVLSPTSLVFLDDTHRHREQELSDSIAAMYGFRVTRHRDGGRAYDVLAVNPTSPTFDDGPGTELARILHERFDIEVLTTCGCRGRIREMNWRGPQWCRENIETIIGWLHDGAQKWKASQRGVAGLWISLIPEFAERAYIRRLVHEAIEMADRERTSTLKS